MNAQKLLCALLLGLMVLTPSFVLAKKKQPKQTAAPVQQPAVQNNSDEDEKIVLTNFALMLDGFGKITTDPNNPAVLGPNIAIMIAGLVNIIYAAFRSTVARNNPFAMEQLDEFVTLSTEDISRLVAEVQSKAIELRRELANQKASH